MATSITVLGSTGVIGRLTLEVLRDLGDRFEVRALTAGQNVDLLIDQIVATRPAYVAVGDETARKSLSERLPSEFRHMEIGVGTEGLVTAAKLSADVVVSAVVGAVGLLPTWAAVDRGATVALANKETLVAGGDLIMPRVTAQGSSILPLDSEHSAIFQCLASRGSLVGSVRKLLVTASGGPFRTWDEAQLENVTVADALRHPTWNMGRKITIDSATLMNKGLEVIEAHHLFQTPYDSIEVVVHPQSIIHSMVEFVDGSIIAQLGPPDMRLPIQYALTYPERVKRQTSSLNFAELSRLSFEAPDVSRFPALRLAYEVGRAGGYAPCVLNAANEVAVGAFLEGKLPFTAISKVVEQALEEHEQGMPGSIEDVVEMDGVARLLTQAILKEGRWRD
ncbi:1-deoxy-D-xylulose-5-phosphate reductoisomerase [Alicyclobacillus ferrooxydans]|uniref:1-deoxy-D-xylulose 5-phosphate reductoisomerase n=1 Tax=Alicyclobacillus ferrooxydans TaxID=471514 RepID=A0A0N8PMW0_9BACL|nr:1-deoxy-D-xylulose-5-phosphate reductoisomerase [Alicyclobacillus ferrooxydans]KPV39821.1 1-deoxy-D-xylulose 5-phosphate reductoisomerase [Alicyclobacillus ferrooxydans]